MSKDDFKPGGYGFHEIVHMAAFLHSAWHGEVYDHGACQLDDELREMAGRVSDAMNHFYQTVATRHLAVEVPPPAVEENTR